MESMDYKYPCDVETNGIARKWVTEELGVKCGQWVSREVCQGVLDGYKYAKCQSSMETWQVSTVYEFLFNLWELKM